MEGIVEWIKKRDLANLEYELPHYRSAHGAIKCQNVLGWRNLSQWKEALRRYSRKYN